jgi:hypothetical protein
MARHRVTDLFPNLGPIEIQHAAGRYFARRKGVQGTGKSKLRALQDLNTTERNNIQKKAR